MWFSGFFSHFVCHRWSVAMMKIAGLSHLFKWENLHNWWLTKYFFAPLYSPFRGKTIISPHTPVCPRVGHPPAVRGSRRCPSVEPCLEVWAESWVEGAPSEGSSSLWSAWGLQREEGQRRRSKCRPVRIIAELYASNVNLKLSFKLSTNKSKFMLWNWLQMLYRCGLCQYYGSKCWLDSTVLVYDDCR